MGLPSSYDPASPTLRENPFQIITARRKGDPITLDQARDALLEEGGSQLFAPGTVQLRFATEEEAQASRQRLIRRFPGTDDVWIITQEVLPAEAFT